MTRAANKRARPPLTAEEVAWAWRMRKEGVFWDVIGAQFQMSGCGIRRRVDPVYQEKRNAASLRCRKARPDRAAILDRRGEDDHRICVPDDVLRERDERRAVAPRSLTAAVLGDPLPGYSALDRRQA